MDTVDATCATDMIRLKTSDSSESEKYMMSDAYHVAQQELDKKDKTMATRDAGLTKEQIEAAEVHAAGSSHCGEIKSKSAFSRYSTLLSGFWHTTHFCSRIAVILFLYSYIYSCFIYVL
jgi:hypothetical protein